MLYYPCRVGLLIDYNFRYNGKILQGFIEGSNVDPVAEIARMIEVQRTYELGQSFLDQEDERIKSVISSLGRT